MSYICSLQSPCIQRLWSGWLEIVPVETGSEESKNRETVYARKWFMNLKGKMKSEKLCGFSTFKDIVKDFSNETRGRK